MGRALEALCLAFPEAAERISHGHPNFFTKKVFAVFGGIVKGDHAADTFSQSMLFLPDPPEREALLGDDGDAAMTDLLAALPGLLGYVPNDQLIALIDLVRTVERAYCRAKPGYYPGPCSEVTADNTKPRSLDLEIKMLADGRFVVKQVREFGGR